MLLAMPAIAAEPSTAEQNKAIARRVIEEVLGQGKFELADQLYAKDFVNHGVTRDVGLKEDQDAAHGWKGAFPDLKMSADILIAEGNLVTVLWTGRGTNTGTGNGLPATGKSLTGRGITIWRIVDGRSRRSGRPSISSRSCRSSGCCRPNRDRILVLEIAAAYSLSHPAGVGEATRPEGSCCG
jgi:predicted ester cyclase